MESYIALLREFGFPVFVSVWFMWRLERRMDRLFELMNAHLQATALLAKSVDDDHHYRRQLPLHAIQQEGGKP